MYKCALRGIYAGCAMGSTLAIAAAPPPQLHRAPQPPELPQGLPLAHGGGWQALALQLSEHNLAALRGPSHPRRFLSLGRRCAGRIPQTRKHGHVPIRHADRKGRTEMQPIDQQTRNADLWKQGRVGLSSKGPHSELPNRGGTRPP